MAVESVTGMSAEEIVELSRKYTLYEWSAQSAAHPIPVDRAEGVYFYTPDGKRFLDFNSQLMSVNIGHGDKRVVDAHQGPGRQARLRQPVHGSRAARQAGQEAAQIAPGDIDSSSSPTAAPEANENAIKLARQATGRWKVLARYRSYHGATGQVITATGDPRRWAAETGVWGVVRVPDTQPWGEAGPRPVDELLRETEKSHPVRGSADHRRIHRRARSRDQRHPHPARRLSAGHSRDVRPIRHLAHRGRGHDRLRPHWGVVGRR